MAARKRSATHLVLQTSSTAKTCGITWAILRYRDGISKQYQRGNHKITVRQNTSGKIPRSSRTEQAPGSYNLGYKKPFRRNLTTRQQQCQHRLTSPVRCVPCKAWETALNVSLGNRRPKYFLTRDCLLLISVLQNYEYQMTLLEQPLHSSLLDNMSSSSPFHPQPLRDTLSTRIWRLQALLKSFPAHLCSAAENLTVSSF